MLRVYFWGYGGHSHFAESLRPIIENELEMKLICMHEWDNADVKWTLPTWKPELEKADIVICPTDPKKFPAKSANKLTQAMSMGKPVICSSLDAYVAVEENNRGCCLFADTPEEWREQLKKLKEDPKLRERMGQRGIRAAQAYHIDRIGEKWISVLTNLDKVDIIIPTYKNLRGIRHCFESIRKCTDVKYRMIVVNNGSSEELHKYLEQQGDITYIKKSSLTFAQAVNEGIKASNDKYVMILNDDVIVSKGWLSKMIGICKDDVGIVGPLSNCDKGWLHSYSLNIGGVDLLPGANTFEQIEPIIPQIYEYQSPYQEKPEREWVAFYCTLIRREALDKAGLLNEEFVNSGEDVDLCYRIKKQGFKIVQNFNAFVFHFGAVSRKMLEQENPGSYHQADKKTNAHLSYLWNKKSIMLYSGPSFEKWDFRNAEKGGIGGSEIWQIMLSREFSNLGYRVISFCDCPESGIKDGDIQYFHYSQYEKYVDQHWIDYFISSRTTDTLKFPIRTGKIYVISHDIWLLSPREQLFLDRVNKFCVLSEWHKDFFKNHHNVPEEKMMLTTNGIDLERFDSINVDRNPYRLHYSSSWDRGLDNILYLWSFIKKEIPEAELHVFYGNNTWKASCVQRNDQEGLKKIADIEEAMKQPGIYAHGRIGQRELAIEMKKASLLLYPQWFSESFFITGIEAQYSGMPVICNRYAGVTTTFRHPELGDTAIMLGNGDSHWPYTKEGREAFFRETVSILKDQNKWQKWSELGKKNSERYSWKNVALNWKKIFEE